MKLTERINDLLEGKALPKTVRELEKELYKRYYEENPEGDARWDLWPDVIKAKKQKDPVKALKKLFKSYDLLEVDDSK